MWIFMVLMLTAGAALAQTPADKEMCQAAWDRIEKIRANLGIESAGPMPEDAHWYPEACARALQAPEEQIRADLKWAEEICDSDCRALIRKQKGIER